MLNETAKATTPPPLPTGNVEQRINALRELFAHGSFFSVNGNACSANHGSCNNCNLERTMVQRLGYPNRQGNVDAWTCAAFARFAWFYVFGQPWDRNASPNFQPPTNGQSIPVAQARPGDIFLFGQNGSDGHWAMYIGSVNGQRRFIQSNQTAATSGQRTNRVCHNTPAPTASNRPLRMVVRANTYDEINTIPTGRYYIRTLTGGGFIGIQPNAANNSELSFYSQGRLNDNALWNVHRPTNGADRQIRSINPVGGGIGMLRNQNNNNGEVIVGTTTTNLTIVPNSDGTFFIRNGASGSALEVYREFGHIAGIRWGNYVGNADQKFIFVPQ
jgi:hypothetical protein